MKTQSPQTTREAAPGLSPFVSYCHTVVQRGDVDTKAHPFARACTVLAGTLHRVARHGMAAMLMSSSGREGFLAAIAAAQAEVDRSKEAPPTDDCAAETTSAAPAAAVAADEPRTENEPPDDSSAAQSDSQQPQR